MEEHENIVENEMQLVAFRVGREDFGVDVQKVESVISLVNITRMPRSPSFVEGIINLRGQIVAVVDLATRLSIESAERSGKTRVVVVEARDVKVGLIVEEPDVINVNKADIETAPLASPGEGTPSFIRGVVKLGERLLILLDVDKVLSEDEYQGLNGVDLSSLME